MKRGNAVDRARQDALRGDLGSALRRLGSFIATGSYTPEALNMAAEIALRMGDPTQAGRYWLLAPASGAEVEQAIGAFARSCGRDARTMASHLPGFRGRCNLDQYPEVVRTRLARFGIDGVFRGQLAGIPPPAKFGWRQKAQLAGCLLLAGALVGVVAFALRALRRAWCW